MGAINGSTLVAYSEQYVSIVEKLRGRRIMGS